MSHQHEATYPVKNQWHSLPPHSAPLSEAHAGDKADILSARWHEYRTPLTHLLMNTHVVKPVNLDHLRRLFEQTTPASP